MQTVQTPVRVMTSGRSFHYGDHPQLLTNQPISGASPSRLIAACRSAPSIGWRPRDPRTHLIVVRTDVRVARRLRPPRRPRRLLRVGHTARQSAAAWPGGDRRPGCGAGRERSPSTIALILASVRAARLRRRRSASLPAPLSGIATPRSRSRGRRQPRRHSISEVVTMRAPKRPTSAAGRGRTGSRSRAGRPIHPIDLIAHARPTRTVSVGPKAVQTGATAMRRPARRTRAQGRAGRPGGQRASSGSYRAPVQTAREIWRAWRT
jgi:hypothetical protein